MDSLSDMLAFDFMRRALMAGLLVAVLCAVMSLFVVLKRMAFAGIGISHAALGGVAVGLFTGIDPALSALVVCVLTALGIGMISRRGRIGEDAAIGILTTGIMALGVVLVGLSSSYQGDLFSYLFGNILAVGKRELLLLMATAVLVLGFVLLFFKELLFVTFDEEVARVTGIPARPLYYGLLIATAFTVVAAIQVVGLILASAMLVVPAAVGYQVAGNWRGILAVAVAAAIGAVLGGLVVSYRYDVAAGGAIVLLLVACFFAALLISRGRRTAR